MLNISAGQLQALEATMLDRQRQGFADWIMAHRALVGDLSRDQAIAIFDLANGEAAKAGIATDARLFVYAVARAMMPAMTAPQYLQTLDVVFGPGPETRQLDELLAIRDRPNG